MYADPPLNPGSDQARRLLEHELSKPKYGDRRGLLERFLDWMWNRASELGDGLGGLPTQWLVVLLVLLAALIGFGLTRIRRHQGPRRGSADDEPVLVTETSAKQLRQAATDALAGGDLPLAYLQFFRAMARAGVERTVVADRPGSTAREVVDQLTRAFPAQRASLDDAERTFEEVRYGGRTPARATVEAIRELDDTIAVTRPQRPAEPSVLGADR